MSVVVVFLLWLFATFILAFGGAREWKFGRVGIATLNFGLAFWACVNAILASQHL